MLSELDQAIEVLENYVTANPSAKILADYDLVYGGDPLKWIRFANSMRLRLAMRVIYADGELARTEAEKSLNDPFGPFGYRGFGHSQKIRQFLLRDLSLMPEPDNIVR